MVDPGRTTENGLLVSEEDEVSVLHWKFDFREMRIYVEWWLTDLKTSEIDEICLVRRVAADDWQQKIIRKQHHGEPPAHTPGENDDPREWDWHPVLERHLSIVEGGYQAFVSRRPS